MGQGPGLAINVLLQLTTGDWAVVLIVLALGLVLKALILWWLHQDTTARGHRPLGWIVAAFLLDIPTLIVWLIIRPPHPDDGAPDRSGRGPQDRERPSWDRPPTKGRRGLTDDPRPLGEDPYGRGTPDPAQAPDRPAPMAPLEGSPPEPEGTQSEVRLTCPECGTRFRERRLERPKRVSCPQCGRTGTLPGHTA